MSKGNESPGRLRGLGENESVHRHEGGQKSPHTGVQGPEIFSRRAYRVYCVFSWSIAVVFVDSSDYVLYVVGFEELGHLLVEIFGALIRS